MYWVGLKRNGFKALGYDTYQEYLNSPEWNSKKEIILDKQERYKKGVYDDNWRLVRYIRYFECEICGKIVTDLNLHHKNYDNVGHEDCRDIIGVCRDCHYNIHLAWRVLKKKPPLSNKPPVENLNNSPIEKGVKHQADV